MKLSKISKKQKKLFFWEMSIKDIDLMKNTQNKQKKLFESIISFENAAHVYRVNRSDDNFDNYQHACRKMLKRILGRKPSKSEWKWIAD